MSSPGSDITKYDPEFYRSITKLSRHSARQVVPLVLELLPAVRSVCDIGCGDGSWLRVFGEHGVSDIVGVDGEYVPKDLLQIPAAGFRPMDLRQRISLPRSFDLAVSVEVAEHLPESRAASFVEDLTRLAPVVLFSAAIPGQGGVDHINEQWQTYWMALFAEYDYILCDALRPQIWKNRQIAYWYRQNALFFCRRLSLESIPRLASSPHSLRLSLVHPEQLGCRNALWAVSVAVPRAVRTRLWTARDRIKKFLK